MKLESIGPIDREQDIQSEIDEKVITCNTICESLTDRSTETQECQTCQRFPLRSFKGVYVYVPR